MDEVLRVCKLAFGEENKVEALSGKVPGKVLPANQKPKWHAK
jgi:hypothetical protein